MSRYFSPVKLFCWLQSPLQTACLRPFSLYKSRSFLEASLQINSFKWHSNEPPAPNYSSVSRRGDFWEEWDASERHYCVQRHHHELLCLCSCCVYIFTYLLISACKNRSVALKKKAKTQTKTNKQKPTGLHHDSYCIDEVHLH